jgi:hypothetical protein
LVAPHGGTQWYLATNYAGGFNTAAEYVLDGFTLRLDEEPDEPRPPIFQPAQIEDCLQAGIGAKFRLNNWIGVEIGLMAGSGTIRRQSREPSANLTADVQLLGGNMAAKIYPLQSSSARVEPWLSVGIRGLAVRPTRGSYIIPNATVERLDGRRFRVSSVADFASGAGVDLNLSRRSGLTFFVEHGYQSGWRSGVAANFRLSVKPPVSPVPYWPKTDPNGT